METNVKTNWYFEGVDQLWFEKPFNKWKSRVIIGFRSFTYLYGHNWALVFTYHNKS